VKLVERYGGRIADSYELALQAAAHEQAEHVVESAVHFMAESIATLAHSHQQVWITNPRAGCTMELFAKEFHVAPLFEQLRERYGPRLLVVAYMNTSGRVKALAGQTGGAVCTSSNARHVMAWALKVTLRRSRSRGMPHHPAEVRSRGCSPALRAFAPWPGSSRTTTPARCHPGTGYEASRCRQD